MPPVSTARIIERERKTSIESIFEQAREEGWSLSELADNLGVTTETARGYLRDYGYEPVYGFRRRR